MRNFIVTGTDTEVGKTYVSCLIVKSLREAGINAAGFKPVACGDRQDARLLREAGPKDLTLDELNPVFLRNATCPYVAARLENTKVDEKVILRAYDALSAAHECVVVEGVGGWEVPIGPGRNFSDMAADFKLPVLLVIGNKLGAINHALLTLNAIKERGLECLGIVFNNVKDEWDTYRGGRACGCGVSAENNVGPVCGNCNRDYNLRLCKRAYGGYFKPDD